MKGLEKIFSDDIILSTNEKGLSIHIVPRYSLPIDPINLISEFVWYSLDDSTGKPPPHVEHTELIGSIQLETTIVGEYVRLIGEFKTLAHPVSRVPISGHDGGIAFQVLCMNQREEVRGKFVWARCCTKKQITTALQTKDDNNVLRLDGHCSSIPNLQVMGQASLTLSEDQRHSVCFSSVVVEIPIINYMRWINRIK